MFLDRRSLLRSGAALAASSLARPFEALAAEGARRIEGYGPLAPARDEATGLALLKLPPGFRYFSFGWVGDPMTDGNPTPPGHDGAAAFPGRDGTLVYVRNHELRVDSRLPFRKSFAAADRTYDSGEAPGGVTAVVLDPRRGGESTTEPRLSGTQQNCAGGATPWGTWLTCEETLDEPGHGYRGESLERTHGWVFEVPPSGAVRPEPIRGLGRMWHEAVAIDPGTGVLYQTEDRPLSGLYRFLPNQTGRPGALHRGGRLEMLAIRGAPGLDTGEGFPSGGVDVHWVPIPDPERCHADPAARDGMGLVAQGREAGGAVFRRNEGAWFGNGRLYFSASIGGPGGWGQIFELDPARARLRLLFESPGPEVLNCPDNLAVSPRGGLVLCEDALGARPYLRGLTADGALFDLAKNDIVLDGERNGLVGDFRTREWAGACFSPDGRWLMASVQWPGISFAITGPWERGAL